jgi:hypothetical protein
MHAMGRGCSREEELEKMNGKDHFRNLHIDGMIILKWILKKEGEDVD